LILSQTSGTYHKSEYLFFELATALGEVLVVLGLGLFGLLPETGDAGVGLRDLLFVVLGDLDLELEDQGEESVDVLDLETEVAQEVVGLVHAFAVDHEVLHEVLGAVRNGPVELLVQVCGHRQELARLVVQDDRQLGEDVRQTVLGAVLYLVLQLRAVDLEHAEVDLGLDGVELGVPKMLRLYCCWYLTIRDLKISSSIWSSSSLDWLMFSS